MEEALLQNRVKALVATVALGTGFDKPDPGFVIHYRHLDPSSHTISRWTGPVARWKLPTGCC